MTHQIDIKALRERFNATQVKLAEVIGVDQSTVSDWETGRSTPRGPALKLILSLTAKDFPQPKPAKAKVSEAAE